MQKNNLKLVFEKFLNGHASKEDLEILMNSFRNGTENSLASLIYDELEKDESTVQSNNHPEITNQVRKALLTKRMEELYTAYADQRISKTELNELNSYLDNEHMDKDLFPLLNDSQNDTQLPSHTSTLQEYNSNSISTLKNKPFSLSTKSWLSIAACILLLFIAFISIFPENPAGKTPTLADIVLPKTNQATIIFDDGTIMDLLHTDKKELDDRGIEIIELGNGQLAFQIHADQKIHSSRQTFYAPKGTTAQLILADGTRVWLNSATQVSYPSDFSAPQRRVSMHGEAYFEVAHKPQQPFIVEADGTQVKVLGTGFNIATNLENNTVFTTLVHGSVEVATSQQKLKITPGMQSVSNKDSGIIETLKADLSKETAWKEGLFKFDDDDIYSVLNKLKVWYNISDYDVQTITTDRFSGTIKRTRKLSQLLTNLEKISSYKFKIMDRRIIVMK